jgi:hypothetical protein
MNTYYIILTSMAVMAVIVFVALFYFKAGYGYLSTSKWGPKISNKAAWVIMEAPAFIFLLYQTISFAASGVETGNSRTVPQSSKADGVWVLSALPDFVPRRRSKKQ